MPTGVRDALTRGKWLAKGLGKGVKEMTNRRKHTALAGSLDSSLDASLEEIRDIFGFVVRSQHMDLYMQHAEIYELEEIERLKSWKQFLQFYSNPGDTEGSFGEGSGRSDSSIDDEESCWGSLWAVEQALHDGRKKRTTKTSEFNIEISDEGNGVGQYDDAAGECPSAEELKKLVAKGVPAKRRGELWQIFAGVKEKWREGYYEELLGEDGKVAKPSLESFEDELPPFKSRPLEKWASQIEKDLPRTFPGHPKLGEDGLGTLRRMLTAYARHNPSVGYCQAMNFIAALLLLFMPEENAFWTLTSIIDDFFEGYYTEKMTEAQVDQLVFQQLVKEHLRQLATHLETVDVEISWFSGAWFLSIFVNVLPWESVLRVWDVLLYEGNRSMLFRTALALLEKHADALIQQRDNGDVLAMLQSMGETTFNSCELVLSACHGFAAIDEKRLQELRSKHRPAIIAALHKRSLDLRQWRTAQAAKQAIKDLPNSSISTVAPSNIAENEERNTLESEVSDSNSSSDAEDEEDSTLEFQFSSPKCLNIAKDEERSTLKPQLSALKDSNFAEYSRSFLAPQLSNPKFFNLQPQFSSQKGFKSGSYSRIDETEEYEMQKSDLQEEVSRLREELEHHIQALEEAECTTEGLKHALMEMGNADIGCQSSVGVEELEAQVAHLKQALEDKHEEEKATVQVLVRLELEKRKAEDACRRAEKKAEANLQIFNKALRKSAKEMEAMEKRAIMTENRLEAMEKRAMIAESRLEALDKQAATLESKLEAMKKRAEMAESVLEAVDKRAVEELAAMKKRAVMAESMLEATLDFHAGSAPRTNRGTDPKLKGDELKDNPGFRNYHNPRQDGDIEWEISSNARKLEEAEVLSRLTANKMSVLGRPTLGDRSKVHKEQNNDIRNQEVGGSPSVSSNSSPASIRKMGNIQNNGPAPELVKLQYIKRRL